MSLAGNQPPAQQGNQQQQPPQPPEASQQSQTVDVYDDSVEAYITRRDAWLASQGS